MDFAVVLLFILVTLLIGAVFALPSILIRLVRKCGPIEFSAKGWIITILSFLLSFYISGVFYLSIADKVHSDESNMLIYEFLTGIPFKTYIELKNDITNILDLPFLPIIFFFFTLIIVPNVVVLTTDIKNKKAKMLYALISMLIFGMLYAFANVAFDANITPFTASAFSLLLGVPVGFGIYNSISPAE